MKIYRDFISSKPGEGTCRMEITLTESEILAAYFEMQDIYDAEDVEANFPHSTIVDMFAGSELVSTEDWQNEGMKAAAKLYREYMEDSEDWYNRLRDAVADTVRIMIAERRTA